MNTTLTVKTEKKLRDAAKKTAGDLGLPLTTIVNALLKQFVREQEITLSARVPTQETRRAIKDVRGKKNITRMNLKEFETYTRSL